MDLPGEDKAAIALANERGRSVATNNFDLELFFELTPDLLCVAGFDGYFKKINPAVSKLLGYTDEELFSAPINHFVHPEDQNITQQNREKLFEDFPLLNFENRYVTKSGGIVWLAWTSMPVYSEKRVYAIAKDITHTKKLEEDRNLLIKDLTKINTDLKQLTFTASHDLRTPVGNLLSVFDLLDTSKIEDEETLEFINILKSATESLKNTLNKYMDGLIQKETIQAQVEEVDLEESLKVVLWSLGFLIKSSNTILRADFTQKKTIRFNKAYLESIFLNLITNSVKYSKPGLHPEISITSKQNNGVSQLIFTDNGQGFDMDKTRDKIFGFNQKFNDRSDSKGIGLYLVYNHITSLGGKISVSSRPNEGAEFVISFKD
ncbi:sensor histidine kinase [Mucilaginibacter gotjawali]|uniref:histidine kinase n=1 Tax=Mucilaginibacter gotjawali TaxID=1550579 RepID=A0A839SQN1_9SPHI|nr:PAS domain-containing sensor histidine kinase [Mucilaginibacter gotjawali]MBB3059130.1 PAS domain S-box-containing protein [Mucilaginibacter gotjawali]